VFPLRRLSGITGVTLTDGGTAFGSFVYDADSNMYSNIDITKLPEALVGSNVHGVNPFVLTLRADSYGDKLSVLAGSPDSSSVTSI